MRVILHGEVAQPGLCCSPSAPVERWKCCGDVGLVDGGVPTIGGTEASVTLEPAVWAKVLVLDTVCLDVRRESIQWTTCCYSKCPQRITEEESTYQRCKHTQECSIVSGEFHALVMDMQRGIDLAKRIIVRQDDDDNEDLLHLLHVYVLPIIKLHSEDKEHVTQALANQGQILHKLDVNINEMTKDRRSVQQTMRHWREALCKRLQSEEEIALCSTAFLKLLCDQLKADLDYIYIYIEMESQKKKFEEAELRVRKKGGVCSVGRLKVAKAEMDAVEERKERIANLLYLSSERLSSGETSPSEEQVSSAHEGYIQTYKTWKDHEKERNELVRRKVSALSVREALFHTEEELTQGSQTTGVEISSDGIQRPTDVFVETSLPADWNTLQIQVKESLELNPVIRQLHSEFTDWIHSYCTMGLAGQPSDSDKSKIKGSSTDAGLRIPPQISHVQQSIRKKNRATHLKGLTKNLWHVLRHHFNQVVHEFVKEETTASECFERVWACYERCLFPSHFQNILQLYEHAYAEVAKELESNLPTFTLREVSETDKQFIQIMGLYAPDFLSAMPQDSEDRVTESGKDETATIEPEVFKKEEKREENNNQTKGRVESGISLQGDSEHVSVVRREKSLSKKVRQRRCSHRKTGLIDTIWVARSQPESSLAQSGPERRPLSLEDVQSHQMSSCSAKTRYSLPSDIHNSNGKDCDSGISSLNVSKDDVNVEPLETGPFSNDPLDKCIQDDPNSQVFLHRFKKAYGYFYDVLKAPAPMSKLYWLFKCLQEIVATAGKQSQLLLSSGKHVPVMGVDDLLPCLILFLLHGNVKQVVCGYHHLMLLDDYMPEFLQAGHFGNAVIQFLFAYSVILRRDRPDAFL